MAGRIPAPPSAEPRSALRARCLKVLERTSLFQALPRRHRRRVASLAAICDYAPGAVIVRAGEPGDAVHVVLLGDVLATPELGEARLLGPESHFGELSLIDGLPRSATVTAEGPVTTARIARSDFLPLLHEQGLAAGLLPGVALLIRDYQGAQVGMIADLGAVHAWRGTDDVEAAGRPLEARDALGWLVLVRHVGVFSALAERHMRNVARAVTVERFADDDTIVLAGATGNALYILLNGCALVRTPTGSTRLLHGDDCFGELALIDGAPRSATVSAVGEVVVARVMRAQFKRLLVEHPGIALGILEGLVAMLRELQEPLRQRHEAPV